MKEKPRILIVEDDAGTLNLLQQIVQRTGYEPVLARGGKEAVRIAHTGPYDLVLLDIMMRDLDGWTVLMTLKADPNLIDTPVIIVSAKTPEEHPTEVEALSELYEDYFVKPFEVDDLVTRIAQVLQAWSK